MTMIEQGSARKEMRGWIRERIEGEIEERGAVDTPGVVDEACDRFLDDQDFVRALVHEIFRPAAYQDARQIISQTRHEHAVTLGDEVVAGSEFERRVASRMERWVENVGRHRDVRVLDMEHEDVMQAGWKRDKRSLSESALAQFFFYLGEHVPPGGGRVRDHFSAEELDMLYDKFRQQHGLDQDDEPEVT